MPPKIKYKTKHAEYDATEFVEFLEKLKNVINRPNLFKLSRTKALTNVIVFGDIISHFEKELGPNGRWKPWSPPYTKQMRKKGKGGNKILQDTGFLRQSFAPGGRDAGARIGKGTIIWFNKAQTKGGFPYAAHHDEGASDGKDPRSFMWLSDSALEKAMGLLLQFALDPRSVR